MVQLKNIFLLIIIAISMVSCDHIPLLEDEPVKDEAYYAIKSLMKTLSNSSIKDSNIAIMMSEIPPFNFSTSNIEAHEGCTDYLVYPGGWSGPTIACGLDLGNIGRENARAILKGIISNKDFDILMSATYFKGAEAEAFVNKHNKLRIGRHASVLLCNRVKRRVWQHAIDAYPNIVNAPPSVQQAVLAQCVLSGAGSDRLRPIGTAISYGDWMAVADLIAIIRADMIGGPNERIWRDDQKMANVIRFSLNPPKNARKDYD
jgi:hypothetical protein